MIRVYTLGECRIDIGRETVRPDATATFPVLLYLCAARGRRVERDELSSLVWPRSSLSRRRHNLRQTLYKLSRLGVRAGARSGPLVLAAEDVWLDYEDGDPPAVEGPTGAQRLPASRVLPGYTPHVSTAWRSWVDDFRARAEGCARRRIIAAIALARREAAWERVERLARSCLELDPLNEEATLALAEATALSGSKIRAIAMLDAYLAELGPAASDARLPAEVLRRRISERLPRRARAALEVPLVGRDSVMRELSDTITQMKAGRAIALLLHGPQGIGKTRVLEEISRSAALAGVLVVSQRAAPDDAYTPGLTLTRLFKTMLGQPGSMGLAPDVLAFLQRLTAQVSGPGDASGFDWSEDALVRALVDLERALAWELALVITLDDTHLADALSRRILHRAHGCLTTERVLLLMTGVDESAALGALTVKHALRRLDPDATARLAAMYLERRGEPASPERVAAFATASGGNPFVLKEAIIAAARRTDAVPLDSAIDALLRQRCAELSERARDLLLTALILGEHASVAMLLQVAQWSAQDSERALVELEEAQILACDVGGAVRVHNLWVSALDDLYPASQIAARRILVASALQSASEHRADAAELLLSSAVQYERAGDSVNASTALARGGAAASDRAWGSAAQTAYARSAVIAPRSAAFQRHLVEAILAASRSQQTDDLLLLLATYGDSLLTSPYIDRRHRALLKLASVETLQLSGYTKPDLLHDCVALASSPDLSQTERLRAALVGTRAAEFASDKRVIDALWNIATTLKVTTSADQSIRNQIAVVGALVRRNLDEACTLAIQHINLFADGHPNLPRALLGARIPFLFDCALDRVGSFLERARSALRAYSVTLTALRIEDAYASHLVDTMRLPQATNASDAATALARLYDYSPQPILVSHTVTRLRIAKGEIFTPPSIPLHYRDDAAATRFARDRTFALSNAAILLARAGDRATLEPVLGELAAHCEHLTTLCPYDYPYAAYAIGLTVTRTRQDGQASWHTYVQMHRPASHPPAPFTVSLLREFALQP